MALPPGAGGCRIPHSRSADPSLRLPPSPPESPSLPPLSPVELWPIAPGDLQPRAGPAAPAPLLASYCKLRANCNLPSPFEARGLHRPPAVSFPAGLQGPSSCPRPTHALTAGRWVGATLPREASGSCFGAEGEGTTPKRRLPADRRTHASLFSFDVTKKIQIFVFIIINVIMI